MTIKMNAMTCNVAGCTAERGPNFRWEKRAGLLMQIIEKYNPDIVGYQEMQLLNLALIRTQVTNYEMHLGLPTIEKNDDSAAYNVIAWKTDRFQKCAAGGIYLSQTPDRWSKGWDSVSVRSATWVRLRCMESGNEFTCINTHLDHRGEKAKVEGSKIIIELSSKIRNAEKLPVILMGDFNSRAWASPDEDPDAYPPPILSHMIPPAFSVYKMFMSNGFRDTYAEANTTNELQANTYHDCWGEAFPPAAFRLDWILISEGVPGWRSVRSAIVRDAEPPIYPSDHYPFIAYLEWK